MKRKICVVVASRANYARIKMLMTAIQAHPDLELQLIMGASALIYRYGDLTKVIENDGFTVTKKIHYLVDGENLITQAKSTGLGILELSTAFDELSPDVVVSVADRYETMATAIAATYQNIPLAHIQGGEISGNIDDSVRHAITKLAHLHFPATKQSAERIIRMGEEPWRVHHVGCPAMDVLAAQDMELPSKEFFKEWGTGAHFDPTKPYLLMMQHPVTSSFGQGYLQVSETLHALADFSMQKVVFWPNADAGSGDVAKAIREFQNSHADQPFSYFINFPFETFSRLLANASCLVGNSSSFLREGSFLGTPALLVGERQAGREHGPNVKFSEYGRENVRAGVEEQLAHGRYEHQDLFGDGRTGEKIAKCLAESELNIVKRCTY